jgi:two-component system nitrogen regulation response regulator GlnG
MTDRSAPSDIDRLVALALAEATRGPDAGSRGLYRHVIEQVERPLLRQALLTVGGNQLRAARLLGINRNTLRKRLRALGLLPERTAPAGVLASGPPGG